MDLIARSSLQGLKRYNKKEDVREASNWEGIYKEIKIQRLKNFLKK
jgi:hypothetical protein